MLHKPNKQIQKLEPIVDEKTKENKKLDLDEKMKRDLNLYSYFFVSIVVIQYIFNIF